MSETLRVDRRVFVVVREVFFLNYKVNPVYKKGRGTKPKVTVP